MRWAVVLIRDIGRLIRRFTFQILMIFWLQRSLPFWGLIIYFSCFGCSPAYALFFYVPPASTLSCIKLVSLIKRARDSLAAMAMGWHDVPVSVPAGDARTKCLGSRCWQGRGGSVPSGPRLGPPSPPGSLWLLLRLMPSTNNPDSKTSKQRPSS